MITSKRAIGNPEALYMCVVVRVALLPKKLCSSNRIRNQPPLGMSNHQTKCVILSLIVITTRLAHLVLNFSVNGLELLGSLGLNADVPPGIGSTGDD